MEQRRETQDYKDKKEKRRLVRVIIKKFKIPKKSVSREYAERIVKQYFGKVDIGWNYYRMMNWCEDNKEKVSLRRFDNWLRKAIEFDQQRKIRNNQEDNIDQIDDEERKRTRELLAKYGRHKQPAGTDE